MLKFNFVVLILCSNLIDKSEKLIYNVSKLAYTNSNRRGFMILTTEYQNYKFYLSSIPRSLAAGVAVSALVGSIIMIVGR